MINAVVLVGRLTKDPELKYSQSGIASCRFTLAVNRPFKNKEGNNEADFVNCVTWRKQAENMANFLRKGSLTGIEGRIQTSNFEGKDGNRVFMTEVVADSVQFLEPRSTNGENTHTSPDRGVQRSGNTNTQDYQQNGQNRRQETNIDTYSRGSGPSQVSDDDLPF